MSPRLLGLAAIAALTLVAPVLGGCGGGSDEPVLGVQGKYGDFFGVAPAGDVNQTDYARMAAGGLGSYHVLLSWPTVEAVKGAYDWSSYDQLFTELARNGIEPIVYVTDTPSFYAEHATDPPTVSAKAFDAWTNFLKAAEFRYGPNGDFWPALKGSEPDITAAPIETWEIWNEPNSSVFWTPAPDPAAYAELVERSSRVLKKMDPTAQVMSAGMFATPQSDGAITSYDFLDSLFQDPRFDDAIDIVGVHPYAPRLSDVFDQVKKTREVIDAAGSDDPMWVTEIGWGSDPDVPSDLSVSLDQQASLLTTSLSTLYDKRDQWGIDGVVWFTWHDTPPVAGSCTWCPSAGLVDEDRDSKPAWLAFTDLTGGTP